MTLHKWLSATLFISLISCMPSNEENVSSASSGAQESQRETSTSYEIFPFAKYNNQAGMNISQPLVISISGDCRGLNNETLKVYGGENGLEGGSRLEGDQNHYLWNAPNGFIKTSDALNQLEFKVTDENSDGNPDNYFYDNGSAISSPQNYYSMADCQNSGTFQFNLFDVKDLSDIIMKNCSHDKPYQFRIEGINAAGFTRSFLYNVRLNQDQCKALNPCDQDFDIGSTSYSDDSQPQVYSLKHLYSSGKMGIEIGEINQTFSGFGYENGTEAHNNPVIACHAGHLFDEISGDSYTTNINNFYNQDLYLFADIDGYSQPVKPIGASQQQAMNEGFNGFGHAIENLIFESATLPTTISVFDDSFASSMNIRPVGSALFFSIMAKNKKFKNFKILNNTFDQTRNANEINATAEFSYRPSFNLLTIYMDGSANNFSNIEVAGNDVHVRNDHIAKNLNTTNLTAPQILADYSLFDDLWDRYFENSALPSNKPSHLLDPISARDYYAFDPANPSGSLSFNDIRAIDNEVILINSAGEDIDIYDLIEY